MAEEPDVGFDLHVDMAVSGYGIRPNEAVVPVLKRLLKDTAERSQRYLGDIQETWVQDNKVGWIWVMGAKATDSVNALSVTK